MHFRTAMSVSHVKYFIKRCVVVLIWECKICFIALCHDVFIFCTDMSGQTCSFGSNCTEAVRSASALFVILIEPRCEKTGLRGFRPGPTQTRLYSHIRWLEARNFGFRKLRDCTIYVAKTKTLISFAVTAKLICVFLFAYMQKAGFLTPRLNC